MNELATRQHALRPRSGVLLINLGSPSEPTAPAIRSYLRQFLGDPRVVEVPRPIWWLILRLFILPFRPRRLVHAYASVWTPDGSPLTVISRRQAAALQARLGVPVELAMTYGEPSIEQALARLDAAGARKLVVLPMYPQYSGSTTGAAFDALFAALGRRRWMPELHTIGSYHDDPAHIAALAASVRRHWAAQGRGEHLLISFHGVPQAYVEKGDPYYCHCHKTARLLIEALGLKPDEVTVSFQSRFGAQPWVQPYTDERIVELAQRGVKRLDALCPGFPADCLETLEEVQIRYGEAFRDAGGEQFAYIPALNDDPGHIEALASLLAPQLAALPVPDSDPAATAARAARLEPLFRGEAR